MPKDDAGSASQRAWRLVVFLSCAGAAGLHFGAVRHHVQEYVPAGAFMLVAGVAQLLWAVWVARGAPRGIVAAGMVGNAAIAAVWVVSRTAGLPFGPEPGMPEPIHGTDALATALEVLAVTATIALLIGAGRPGPLLLRLACAGALAAVMATGDDPLRERLAAVATLALAFAARALVAALPRLLVVRSDGRSYDKAAFRRRIAAGRRCDARAGVGAGG